MTSCIIFHTLIITLLTLHIRIRGCFLSEKRLITTLYGHVFALRRGNTIHSWFIIDGVSRIAKNPPGYSCPLYRNFTITMGNVPNTLRRGWRPTDGSEVYANVFEQLNRYDARVCLGVVFCCRAFQISLSYPALLCNIVKIRFRLDSVLIVHSFRAPRVEKWPK